MNNKTRNILIMSLSLASFSGVVAYNYRRKKSIKRADSFFAEIQKKLDPAKNLIDEIYNTNNIKVSNQKMNRDEHKAVAENIWDSWGIFNDDEEKVYSQLRLIEKVDDWKAVMKEYMILSDGVALDLDLKNRLSSEEHKTVRNIIKSYN